MNDPFNATGMGPLAQVQMGMKVVDADGVEVGSVEDMSMSDPAGVTTEGEDFRPTGASRSPRRPGSSAATGRASSL